MEHGGLSETLGPLRVRGEGWLCCACRVPLSVAALLLAAFSRSLLDVALCSADASRCTSANGVPLEVVGPAASDLMAALARRRNASTAHDAERLRPAVVGEDPPPLIPWEAKGEGSAPPPPSPPPPPLRHAQRLLVVGAHHQAHEARALAHRLAALGHDVELVTGGGGGEGGVGGGGGGGGRRGRRKGSAVLETTAEAAVAASHSDAAHAFDAVVVSLQRAGRGDALYCDADCQRTDWRAVAARAAAAQVVCVVRHAQESTSGSWLAAGWQRLWVPSYCPRVFALKKAA